MARTAPDGRPTVLHQLEHVAADARRLFLRQREHLLVLAMDGRAAVYHGHVAERDGVRGCWHPRLDDTHGVGRLGGIGEQLVGDDLGTGATADDHDGDHGCRYVNDSSHDGS